MIHSVFDAHLHIIDPGFPLVANQGYLPDPFTTTDYQKRLSSLNMQAVGGAVVSGSFQAFDQSYLVHALRALGAGYVGVTNLQASATNEQIIELDRAGVRAVRFNLFRGGSEKIDELETMAHRVHELARWHTELYIHSGQLQELYSMLRTLPSICIDHLGLSRQGLPDLLRLVEDGAHVKATGFSRTDLDVSEAIRAICSINPVSLMFGSDLPCTRAPAPFAEGDLLRLCEAAGAELVNAVLVENARKFYRCDSG